MMPRFTGLQTNVWLWIADLVLGFAILGAGLAFVVIFVWGCYEASKPKYADWPPPSPLFSGNGRGRAEDVVD